MRTVAKFKAYGKINIFGKGAEASTKQYKEHSAHFMGATELNKIKYKKQENRRSGL